MADTLHPGSEGILEKGDDLLWQRSPGGGLDFSDFWSFQTVFAMIFSGFLLFWIVMASVMTDQMTAGGGRVLDIVFPLFGLPLLLIGLHLLLGRFWTDPRWRCSYYTQTDRAACIIGGETRGKRSLDRYAIGPNTRLALEYGDWGTAWLASNLHTTPRHAPQMHRCRTRIRGATQTVQSIGLERLSNARQIYAMMRKVQIDRANAGGTEDAGTATR